MMAIPDSIGNRRWMSAVVRMAVTAAVSSALVVFRSSRRTRITDLSSGALLSVMGEGNGGESLVDAGPSGGNVWLTTNAAAATLSGAPRATSTFAGWYGNSRCKSATVRTAVVTDV